MTNAFPSAFLEPLLRISLAKDAGTRRIVQEILHTLLDRHENLPKLKSVKLVQMVAAVMLRISLYGCVC
jgi:protein EFR3